MLRLILQEVKQPATSTYNTYHALDVQIIFPYVYQKQIVATCPL